MGGTSGSLHLVTPQLWPLQHSAEDLHMLPIDHQELSESFTAEMNPLAAAGAVQTDPALPSFVTWLDFLPHELELGQRPVA